MNRFRLDAGFFYDLLSGEPEILDLYERFFTRLFRKQPGALSCWISSSSEIDF